MLGRRICVICGKEYQPRKGNQKTCGSVECQAELHRQNVRKYNKLQKPINGKSQKEYKRDMMRKYREEAKDAREKKKKPERSYMKRICKTCEWREFDQIDGICVCVNPSSPKCSEEVLPNESCKEWK